ncbi:MAG: tetratricopeptide repeat protein [Deltaproteobacteria bacterium]|nr:tetratricopeptide repeat protein [Deltaproteobacteria bacterium]
MTDPREQFRAAIERPELQIDLAETALWVAAEEYPGLDVPAYLARLDGMAQEVGPRVRAAGGLAARVDCLNDYLFRECGFAGNREHYDDPRNSFLNDVLDRGCGLPITLAIVYVEVGHRLGLPVRGVGFPGHFLAKLEGEPEILVDAFFGRTLTRGECAERLRAVLGSDAKLEPLDHLRAATTREIIARLLTNLKQVYAHGGDWLRALACCDRLLLLTPDAASELRDRAIIYERLDCFSAAASDVERLLEIVPESGGDGSLRARLTALRHRVGPLH